MKLEHSLTSCTKKFKMKDLKQDAIKMAPHSSTLAWKIPWVEEPGRLQSMGSLGVGHDWVTSLSLFTFMHWRRKWQPTPVFLRGESQGRGSLVGCHLWGRTESDTTEATWQQHRSSWEELTSWQYCLPILRPEMSLHLVILLLFLPSEFFSFRHIDLVNILLDLSILFKFCVFYINGCVLFYFNFIGA